MKVTYQETRETIDENGVIKKTEKTTVKNIPTEPDFIKLYLQDICKLNDIPKTSNKILNEFLKISQYGNRIVLNATIKKEIAENLQINYHTIDNTLNNLIKKNILKKHGTGVYILNPFLFGRGDWRTIQNLRFKIDYDFINKKKTMEVETTNLTNSEEKTISENNNATQKLEEKKPKKVKSTNITANSRAIPNPQFNATV